MNIEKIINHWINTSDDDFDTMMVLFNSKKYNWALFLGHISVEKLLKAYYVRKNESHAPPIHNLLRIAQKSGIDIPEKYADWLDTITFFNINTRYDDYKKEFYDLCTKEFTENWIEKIKEIRKWIKEKLKT